MLTRRHFDRLQREHEDFSRVVKELSDARAAAPRTGGQCAKKKREGWLRREMRKSRTAKHLSRMSQSARGFGRKSAAGAGDFTWTAEDDIFAGNTARALAKDDVASWPPGHVLSYRS